MMDSDNRNALDNYGVWVKKAPKDSSDKNKAEEAAAKDDFEISADLPDFSSLDNLQDDSPIESSFDTGATSLTSEELLNITGNIDESSEPQPENDTELNESAAEAPSEPQSEDFSLASSDDIFNMEPTESADQNDQLDAFDSIAEDIDFNKEVIGDIKDDATEEITANETIEPENKEPAFDEMIENDDIMQSDIASDFSDDKIAGILSQNTQSEDTPLDIEISDEPDSTDETPTEESMPIPDTFEEEATSLADPEITFDDKKAESETVEENTMVAEEEPQTPVEKPEEKDDISARSNSILEQIEKELTALRTEISSLKNDFNELKNKGVEKTPEKTEEGNSGFFGDVSEDEIISLSGDELDNILNNASFTEEEADAENEKKEVFEDEPKEESIETSEEDNTVQAEEPLDEFKEMPVETTEPESDADITSETIEDTAIPDSSSAEVNEDDDFYKDVSLDTSNDLQIDFNNEHLEEPKLDDFSIDDDESDNQIPDEIIVPKIEDVLVESSNSDLMASGEPEESEQEPIADIPETAEEPIEEADIDTPEIEEPLEASDDSAAENDVVTDSPFEMTDMPESTEEVPVENDVVSDSPFEMTDMPESTEETPAENDVVSDSPFEMTDMPESTEETPAESDVVSDSPFEMTDMPESTEETEIIDDTASESMDDAISEPEDTILSEEDKPQAETIDDLYPKDPPIEETLTNDNLDYLSTDSERSDIAQPEATKQISEEMPQDLKKDIKSVLSYMDQLLENLPDEKISEFAQSEQFITYKKLFTELGLA